MRIDKQVIENKVAYLADNMGFTFVGWFDLYKGIKSKAIIRCDKHGDWNVRADSFIGDKSKCPKCINLSRVYPETKLINTINRLGLGKYSFVKWVESYRGSSTRAIIKCHEHGEWECKSSTITNNGSGCKKCADANKTIDEKDRLTTIYNYCNDKHYSFIGWVGAYSGSNSRCIIQCEKHGEWEVRSSSFLRGHHCPSCGNYGYDYCKPGDVYVLRSKCFKFFKVGISNTTSRRLNELTKRTPFDFEIIKVMSFADGRLARIIEKTFHSCFDSSMLTGFDGATEWMKWDDDVLLWINHISPSKV